MNVVKIPYFGRVSVSGHPQASTAVQAMAANDNFIPNSLICDISQCFVELLICILVCFIPLIPTRRSLADLFS